jgi:uncharacterized membrane protein
VCFRRNFRMLKGTLLIYSVLFILLWIVVSYISGLQKYPRLIPQSIKSISKLEKIARTTVFFRRFIYLQEAPKRSKCENVCVLFEIKKKYGSSN